MAKTSVLKLFIYFSIICLMACGQEKEQINEIDHPELIAVAFFDAIYNQKDIKKAATVCSPQLARILLHYKSTSAVGRHIFNMPYDQVKITPDDSGVKVREQFENKAVITIYFDGMYKDERRKDVKKLSLIQLNGKWIIDKILKDPF